MNLDMTQEKLSRFAFHRFYLRRVSFYFLMRRKREPMRGSGEYGA